jgi:hypothetical protein
MIRNRIPCMIDRHPRLKLKVIDIEKSVALAAAAGGWQWDAWAHGSMPRLKVELALE